MKITHIGHACFLIENETEKLIIDPYDESIGYEKIEETVNYILISHDHYDHNYTKNITLEENNGSFKIQKIDSFHDNQGGRVRGNNIIHVIETDDTRICHLGDLGHLLDEEQIKEIGKIDVLLIPVGGTYTIDYEAAEEVTKQLNPMMVIPMHYKTDKLNLNIAPVDNFIRAISSDYKIIKLDTNELDYEKIDERVVVKI